MIKSRPAAQMSLHDSSEAVLRAPGQLPKCPLGALVPDVDANKPTMMQATGMEHT